MIDFEKDKLPAALREEEAPAEAESTELTLSKPRTEIARSSPVSPTPSTRKFPLLEAVGVLVAGVFIAIFGITAFSGITSAAIKQNSISSLREVAQDVDSGSVSLPQDTKVFGNFDGKGSLIYRDSSKKVLNSEPVSAANGNYQISGTVGSYTILFSSDDRDGIQLYSYSSKDGKIVDMTTGKEVS